MSARVLLDPEGAPRDFSTTDRFTDLPGGLVGPGGPHRWTAGAPSRDGGYPSAPGLSGLPDGPFRYAELTLGSGVVIANVPPGA